MTAMTAAYSAPRANSPLPFTKDAIINQLQRQATNGPAYVQHSATKALAHLKGLYAEDRYEARQRFDAVRDAAQDAAQAVDQTTDKLAAGYRRVTELMNGAEPTAEELAYCRTEQPLDDDEPHEAQPEDEPP